MKSEDKAKTEVSEEIRSATKNCVKSFSCLCRNRGDSCKINKKISKDLVFVDCKTDNYCYYKLSFGDSFTCTCPVRKELFKRYDI